MKLRLGKRTKFALRWGIAVFGIAYVLSITSFHDHILTVSARSKTKIDSRIVDGQPENSPQFQLYDSQGRPPASRDDIWTPPGDRGSVPVMSSDGKQVDAKVIAIHPVANQQRQMPPAELLVQEPHANQARIIKPADVVGGYVVNTPYPLIEFGLIRLVREARLLYLILAVAVLPISFIITSIRWHMLLEALDIHMGQGRAFVLNMVGAFYNSFMPGSTGGDLIKAYYAAKHTPHRARAVMTVIIDRILGLLALIILGGVMAGVQWRIPTCRNVALISAGLIGCTALGCVVFYNSKLRKLTGLDWFLKRLPMQKQVHKAVETMELYGKNPGTVALAILMTFPVHMTTIISATFAGKAFGLRLAALYYWAVVPVITLVGAIPISPQGVGVMEPLAVELTRRQGVTVSQAFALVMAIRFSAMFWNLVASIFVLRGGYHAPTEAEAHELEEDDEDGPTSATQSA